MQVLIVYTTNSGSNYFVAEALEQTLNAHFTVVMKKAEDTRPEDLAHADLVIMGSPSWTFDGKEGQPSTPMSNLLLSLETQTYPAKPFALFGCGDSSYTYLCGAVDVLESFVTKVQGKLIADSLRIDKFYNDYDHNIAQVKSWADQIAVKLK